MQKSELSNLYKYLINFKVRMKIFGLAFVSNLLLLYNRIPSNSPSRTGGSELPVFIKS